VSVWAEAYIGKWYEGSYGGWYFTGFDPPEGGSAGGAASVGKHTILCPVTPKNRYVQTPGQQQGAVMIWLFYNFQGGPTTYTQILAGALNIY